MKLYLAGPMTGIENLNFPLFRAEAERLRSLGHRVINPAEINTDPTAAWADCMRADIQYLMTCEAIALLPGWRKSRGATLERHIAIQLGLGVYRAEALTTQVGEPEYWRADSLKELAREALGLVELAAGDLPPPGTQRAACEAREALFAAIREVQPA